MRIGIDIGGMTIKASVIDHNYHIITKKIIETKADELTPEGVVKNIESMMEELLEENEGKDKCEAIGIACPGTIDTELGRVVYSNNIKWSNVPLIELLKQRFEMPMSLVNDADAAVLGEVLNGAAKGKRNAVMLTLGTGVGGGVILDGKIFQGTLLGGCELGHMVINTEGRRCTCGRKGCLEMYASASALMRQARRNMVQYPNSILNEWCQYDTRIVDGKMIFQAEREGDYAAGVVVKQYEENLAIGIANMINIFRPEIFILGGGVSAQKEYLTNRLQKLVEGMCFGGRTGGIPPIVTAELGNDAGMIGAAYNFTK